MPDVLLPVPHFEQAKDGTCLPACVQMVLAYWGNELTEQELISILDTQSFGTPISNVKRLEKQGYQISVASLTVSQLKDHLLTQKPLICRVWTVMLDYWSDEVTSHVVVVVGFDENQVYLNDPAIEISPQTISWDGFLAAWAEFDETTVIIHPTD